MLSVQPEPGGHLLHDVRAPARLFRYCANRMQHQVCNWLVPADDPQPLCASCRLNSVIPNLGVARNLLLWARLEAAKRRLLYDLTRLGLRAGAMAAAPELRFEFLEDQRSNPDVLESFRDHRPRRRHDHHQRRRSGSLGSHRDARGTGRALSHPARAFPPRERSLLFRAPGRRAPRYGRSSGNCSATSAPTTVRR